MSNFTSDAVLFLSNPVFFASITGIVGAVLGSWFTYILALRRFHREKQYENKLSRYLLLVDKMRGFINGIGDEDERKKDRKAFADSYRTIWLYGSAKVIKHVSSFLDITLNPQRLEGKSEDEKERIKDDASKILKKAVIAMRKDLKAKGRLQAKDFGLFF